jgi:hypothetical protein
MSADDSYLCDPPFARAFRLPIGEVAENRIRHRGERLSLNIPELPRAPPRRRAIDDPQLPNRRCVPL